MEIFFLFIIVVLITGIFFNLKQNVKIKRENISIEELINVMQKEYGKEYTIKKKFGSKLWIQKGLIAISCVLKNKKESNSINIQYESRFSILFHIIPTAYAVWSGKKELKNVKSFIEKSNYLQCNNLPRYDNNAESFFKEISKNAINNSKHSNNLLDKKLFSGGDGSKEQNAVIINATNSADGIDAEYIFIQSKFGMRGVNWKLERQMLTGNNSKKYDVMVIKLSDGSTKEIYFDITSFLGKSN